MSMMRIGDRMIGEGQRTLIIAEIGVNHDGSLARAQQLINIAADAGADAVKFQIFTADRLVHSASSLAEYQKRACADADPASMLRRYELPPLEVAQLVELARSRGLLPLATPFSPHDVQIIEHLDLPAAKVASPDLVNWPLLKRIAQLGRPMLVSAGAATMGEVDRCVTWLREWGVGFALLHCISAYPTPAADAHLSWIGELSERLDVPIGYSDHTTELLSGAFAVSAGACIVERHLTYDRAAAGPDHAASSDPHQFAEYVRLVRLAEQMRGRGPKRVLPIEQDVRNVSRQSLVLMRDLRAGDAIEPSHLTVQRPGTGISAAEISRAIGRRAKAPLRTGTLLTWDMLSDAA